MWTLFELHYTPKRYHFKRNQFVYTSHCSRKIPCTLAINIALHAAMFSAGDKPISKLGFRVGFQVGFSG